MTKKEDDTKCDEILLRMLKTPPKKHAQLKDNASHNELTELCRETLRATLSDANRRSPPTTRW
jgi:hypothetical protein